MLTMMLYSTIIYYLHVSIPMVMPHPTTTTKRIAPTIAPTGGDPVGMKKLKVMLHSWSCHVVGWGLYNNIYST